MNELRNRGPIRGVGEVLARRDNGLWQVKMVNGYEVDAHLDRKLKESDASFEIGDRLSIEFSAYDLSLIHI